MGLTPHSELGQEIRRVSQARAEDGDTCSPCAGKVVRSLALEPAQRDS